jgi:hypothetical protein
VIVRSVVVCVQESEEIPRDFTTLFDASLFGFDVALIPEVIKLSEARPSLLVMGM